MTKIIYNYANNTSYLFPSYIPRYFGKIITVMVACVLLKDMGSVQNTCYTTS